MCLLWCLTSHMDIFMAHYSLILPTSTWSPIMFQPNTPEDTSIHLALSENGARDS